MIDPTKKLDRILMFLPGFFTWMMLFMPIWLGLLYPSAASFLLTFFAVYWMYMAWIHAYGLYKGYRSYKMEISTDWWAKIKELDYKNLPNQETLPPTLDELKHLILIPTVAEGIDILEPTFKSIIDSNYDTSKIIVVVGTEERGEEVVREALSSLKDKYGEKFPEYLHYIHPPGIPGEIVGVASPNRSWAGRHAVEELEKRGENINHYIFTTYDSDTVIHPEFLGRLTYLYLTDGKRFNKFFETNTRIFDNNYWQVPVMSRVEASNITIGVLSGKIRDATHNETFACYSCALDTLVKADYWDVKFIDDSVFFWRAMVGREGDFAPSYFYIPVHADATDGKNYVKAHVNLFKQLVRWGWGSVTTVMAIKLMFFEKEKIKKLSLDDKIVWLFFKFERHLFLRSAVFLMTFGFFIITLVNVQFTKVSTVYSLPQVISLFMTAGIFMLIPTTIVKLKIYKFPENFNFMQKVLGVLESVLIFVDLWTYSFIPWLYAETLLMFGKLPKVTFYTPKVR